MVLIYGKHRMRFECHELSDEKYGEAVLVNCFTVPSFGEVQYIPTTPFASLLLIGNTREKNRTLFQDNNFEASYIYLAEKYCLLESSNISGVSDYVAAKNIVCVGDMYDTIGRNAENASPFYLIGAVPIRGILEPIRKSPDYRLYNGMLLVSKTSKEIVSFQDLAGLHYQDECWKFAYLSAEIYGSLNLTEHCCGEFKYRMVDNEHMEATLAPYGQKITTIFSRFHETLMDQVEQSSHIGLEPSSTIIVSSVDTSSMPQAFSKKKENLFPKYTAPIAETEYPIEFK